MSRHPPPDALGVQHPAAGPEARIVSLVPSITELLFHLGLGDQVVGRTSFCVHPRERLARLPRVGGTKKPRMDKLRALRPTHVIVNVDENREEDMQPLAAFVPHVIVTHPLRPDDNLALYRLLGGLFGRQAPAEQLCAEYSQAREDLRRAAAGITPRRVLYLIWRDPWMTISRDTYISRMLALVNWTSAEHDPEIRYPGVRADPALRDEVDLVLFSSEPFPFKPAHMTEFRRLTGFHERACAFIDGEMISWYGSRAVAGLQYLRNFAAGMQND